MLKRIKYNIKKRWVELIKDYDCVINYHHNKANMVVDALRRKSQIMVEVSEMKNQKRDDRAKKARYPDETGT